MVSELFGNLISCETCGHGIGAHDGSGCHVAGCSCGHSMQVVLEQNISSTTKEFQQQYRVAD